MPDGVCPVIVGRDAERARLRTAAEQAAAGRGGLLFVLGEAGIGKSRLVADLVDHARDSGLRVLSGRSVAGALTPYRPWAGVLRQATRDESVLADPALASWQGALSALLPAADTRSSDGSLEARAEAVVRMLRAVAGRGLVVVLEDLHWADPDTLSLLELVSDSLTDERILCVATSRSGGGVPAVELSAGLHRAGVADVIALRPLSTEQAAVMVRACVAGAAPDLIEQAQHRGDGIPLLIEELALSGRRPITLADSVRDRLRDADPAGTRVWVAAALLGRRFDWRLLPAAAGVPDDLVKAVLDAGLENGLITSDEDGPAFRHDLLRDAVLAAVSPVARAAVAAATLAAVESAHPDLDGSWVDVAAELAGQAGDWTRAVELRIESGRASLARGALATAIVTLRRVAELRRDGPLRVRADLLLLDALAQAGRYDEAWHVGQRLAHELAASQADRGDRLATHLHLARAAIAATHWDEARAESRAARQLIEDADAESVGELLLVEAEIAIGEHRDAQAQALATRAAQLAAPRGSAARCHALEIIGRTTRARDLVAARAVFEQALQEAESAGLPLWRLSALHQLGTIDMFERCGRRRLEEARRLAIETGALSTVAVLSLQLCAVEHGRFDRDRAFSHAEEARELSDRLGLTEVRYKALLFLSAIHALRFDWEQADECHRRAIAGREDDPYAVAFGLGGFALGEFLDDRHDRAASHFERAAELLAPLSDVEPATFRAVWPLLLAVSADPRAAGAIEAAQTSGVGVFAVNRGLLGYATATLLGQDAQAAAADRSAAAADRFFENCEFWQHVARGAVVAAAERDGWGEPARWRDAARARFQTEGLTRLAGRLSPRDSALTARERDVLALLGAGLTNRDIAVRLSISPRTVEKHVESLLRKTHARTRTQLAVRYHERAP